MGSSDNSLASGIFHDLLTGRLVCRTNGKFTDCIEVAGLDALDDGSCSNEVMGSGEVNSVEQNNNDVPTPDNGTVATDELVEPPRVGQLFGSWVEVESYYRKYGMQQGFGVVRVGGGILKNETDKKNFRNATWKCECWGVPHRKAKRKHGDPNGANVKLRKSKKCGCEAMIYAGVNEDNILWVIKKVVLEHTNHNPIPTISQCISQHRQELMNEDDLVPQQQEQGHSVPGSTSDKKIEDHVSQEKFQGINVSSSLVPILQKIQDKHGDIIQGHAVHSPKLLTWALETLANMVVILQGDTGSSLNDSQAKYLNSSLLDLRLLHFDLDWLIPSVTSALAGHKSKEHKRTIEELEGKRSKLQSELCELEARLAEEHKLLAESLSVMQQSTIKDVLS